MTTPSVAAAYTQWSATYDTDRNLTRDLDQQVTRTLLGGRRYSSILEIGCGTGKNTVFLAQIGEQVRALDFSEGMLEQAKAKQPGPNVTFAVADLTQPWPCADQSVELIVCNLVLEHIAELSWIFSEARRTLTAGGQFYIAELHPFKQYIGSKARFEHNQERIEPDAFVHHISEFYTAATNNGFILNDLKEWWHAEDQNAPPRLVSFLFVK